MISATRHLIYVKDDMRNEWFDFWQVAQRIDRAARREPDEVKRPPLIASLIAEKVKFGRANLDLRELH